MMRRSLLRIIRKMVGIRVGTFYYCFLICLVALCFGVGTLALSGGGLIAADHSLEKEVHGSSLVVAHDKNGEHHQTLLGDILFGKDAQAHAGWYCGHDERWITIDGVLHKQVFLYHSAGDVHHYKSAHYAFTGTGYTRLSDWFYNKIQC